MFFISVALLDSDWTFPQILQVTLTWGGELHVPSSTWPRCLSPPGSSSRWLQRNVSLDPVGSNQQSVRCGSTGRLRSVVQSCRRVCLVPGKPEPDFHTLITVIAGCHSSKGLRPRPSLSRSKTKFDLVQGLRFEV